jgi:CBS-domain-containing membrane protein
MGPGDEKGTPNNRGLNFLDLGWSAVGAAVAIALALWFVGGRGGPFLLASLGGSTVFLFALTEAEAAQPRALLGGHLGGALVGILCFQAFGGALWVSVAAVVLTMVFMVLTRTIHPPAGANPLLMVHNQAGFYALLTPVGVGVITLFLVAVLWSRFRRGRPYPVKWW